MPLKRLSTLGTCAFVACRRPFIHGWLLGLVNLQTTQGHTSESRGRSPGCAAFTDKTDPGGALVNIPPPPRKCFCTMMGWSTRESAPTIYNRDPGDCENSIVCRFASRRRLPRMYLVCTTDPDASPTHTVTLRKSRRDDESTVVQNAATRAPKVL